MISNLKCILEYHLSEYPNMEPQDLYKLLYQSEFGPSHFNLDDSKVKVLLERELNSVTAAKEKVEYIGGGFERFYLYKGMDVDMVSNIFINSSKKKSGSLKHFKMLLDKICKLLPSFNFLFSRASFEAFVDEMKEKGYPDVHHSEIYRQIYCPHYRVLKASKEK